ncbi:hypothetical protein HN51_007045 [Arachis hypogaea]
MQFARGKVPQWSCGGENCTCKARVAATGIDCGGHRHCSEDRRGEAAAGAQTRTTAHIPSSATKARRSSGSNTGRGFCVPMKTTVVKAHGVTTKTTMAEGMRRGDRGGVMQATTL